MVIEHNITLSTEYVGTRTHGAAENRTAARSSRDNVNGGFLNEESVDFGCGS
jgi:hypothetical protein